MGIDGVSMEFCYSCRKDTWLYFWGVWLSVRGGECCINVHQFVVLSSFVVKFMSFFVSCGGGRSTSLLTGLRRVVCHAGVGIRYSPFCDCRVRCPTFFRRIPSSLVRRAKYYRFCFKGVLGVTRATFIVAGFRKFAIQRKVRRFTVRRRTARQQYKDSCFLLSKPLCVGRQPMRNCHFCTGCIRQRGL